MYFYQIKDTGAKWDQNQTNHLVPLTQSQVFVSVYPNPASTYLNLDFVAFADGKFDVQFIDISGKVVYENHFEKTNGEKIDVSSFKRGFYLVKILIDNQVVEVQKVELK